MGNQRVAGKLRDQVVEGSPSNRRVVGQLRGQVAEESHENTWECIRQWSCTAVVVRSSGRARKWSCTKVIMPSGKHLAHTQQLSHSAVSVHDSKRTWRLSCSAMDMFGGLTCSAMSMYDSKGT
ncbi:hypothetical protein AMTR_s00083p00094140 [Amborella trichopoda]|uniref:Uncharacterized protein n=1 Tax=Amborella trichopoda TaxID=13333 RepID=W1P3L2_AMBTC|nr:hypothetical protein AMTR_s00083p00094140 [Amborella trichopoda]